MELSLQKTRRELPLRVWRALSWEKARIPPPDSVAPGDQGQVVEVGRRQMVSRDKANCWCTPPLLLCSWQMANET